jgi:predicted TIM-barrel fold metal-dependent hydrolase
MQIIDSDGHLHEPFDLFERYMEKEFFPMRPRIVDLRDEPRDTGRWLVEGKLVPRLPFTRGVGGGGFRYQTPRHSQMKAKDNSLDDIAGRLQDMDRMEIDYQIVYPTALVWVFDMENRELAAAVCRAYNNYIAEQCAKAPRG